MSNSSIRCPDLFLERISDGYRGLGLFLFLLTNLILISSLIWWYKNRTNARLAVRPVGSTIFFAIYVASGTFAEPLRWFSLNRHGGANSCPYVITFRSTKIHALFVAIAMRMFAYRFRYILYKRVSKMHSIDSTLKSRAPSVDDQSLISSQGRLRWVYYLSSNLFLSRFTVGFFVLLLPITLIQIFKLCPEVNDEASCLESANELVGSGITFGLIITLAYTVYETWYFADPFGITRESLINVGIEAVGLTILWICFKAQPMADYFESEEDVGVTPDMFLWLASFLNMIYSFPYQVYLSQKHTSVASQMTLSQVIEHPGARKMLEQHLKEENSADNLIFYMQAAKWAKDYDSKPGDVRNKMADNIYARWLKPGANHEVNVSNKERAKVEMAMETKATYPQDLFEDIAFEVFRLIEGDSFFRFKNGPLFRIFIGLAFSDDVVQEALDQWPRGRRLTDI